MIYVLILMSLSFIVIGYTVNENNAKKLIAGYNSMSEEERKSFNLRSFIPFFRKFHLVLGISFFMIGIIINFFMGKFTGSIFLAVYPLSAYIYFISKIKNFSGDLNT